MMSSVLQRRSTLIWFSLALLVAAALDVGSTLFAFQRMGGSHGEANPIFRALGGHESGSAEAVLILVSIKATVSLLAILWLGGVMRRIPALYPPLDEKLGFVRFANNLFYGKDVPWWTSLLGIPPFRRIRRFLSVPLAAGIAVSGVAVSLTNTFALIASYVGLIVFWIATAVIGFLLGIEFLRRDYLRLLQQSDSQQDGAGQPAAAPNSDVK